MKLAAGQFCDNFHASAYVIDPHNNLMQSCLGRNSYLGKLRQRSENLQESLALASMARDDPPTSSTASSMAAAMRGKVGSEFET